ncbi:MAG: 1-phosphofructokinase family hexose kinase [Micromonosporaceae bacterium]
MDVRVMVFAPVPQLTVTIEQVANDTELHLHAGGQGIWQARMIAGLGVPVTLCAVLGGEVGRVLEPLIATEGVELRAVLRTAANGWYVHDRRDGKRRAVAEVAGPPLGRHELDEIYTLALAEGLRSEMAVLSGPADPGLVPPDAYRRLATDLTANGGRVAADLSGDHLASVLEGRPELVKVSHEEIAEVEDPVKALHRLRDSGAGTVIVSRAEQPALALVGDDVVEVRMPQLEVADHRGAGDSMTAGVVSVLAQGGDLGEALRVGAAAGALNVTRHGLGSGRIDAIRELARRVRLEPVAAS